MSLPVYPYEALRDKAKGKARVVYVVDQTGQVIESKVASADRPEFGEALRAAVHTFRFDPALNKGKPGLFLAAFEHTFSPSKMDVGEEMDLLILEKKSPEKIVSAGKLDTKLRPISQRAPDFPPSLQATQPKGSATVEFLVDKRGRVRLPRVVEASAPEFGYAAVQAISTWLFEPPVAKGKPTVVRVQVPVEFSLKS